MDYQFDLMIEDPASQINDFVTAGATQLVLHVGSKTTQQALQAIVERRDQMGTFSVAVGVALPLGAQPVDLNLCTSRLISGC